MLPESFNYEENNKTKTYSDSERASQPSLTDNTFLKAADWSERSHGT